MKPFTYISQPSRVVFGAGSVARLPQEVEKLGAKRALVLSTPGRSADVQRIAATLGDRFAGLFDKAVRHVPIEVAEDARRAAKAANADCCVVVGGGSTIGLGKAIALSAGLPVLAVPTTYSGSEMTWTQGFTEGGRKRTQVDPKMLPKTVIYDPELTLGLPAAISAASGMNAIAHCVEALYAKEANPIVSLIAEEGIRALAVSLPVIVRNPRDMEARGEALYGAWLAGTCLNTGIALHHKLCHTLGGTWNLPHAETHAIVLPHAVRYNRDAAPEAMARIARALGGKDAAGGLYDLEVKLGLKMKLSDLGVPEGDLARAAKIALEAPYPNPAPITFEGVLALLKRAHAGVRPD
ncbi:MAG: maleylacetate reductase [Betaproteobacteria bacterium]|nr:maleylacetate reductase [Betaproteobacteria bacterium]